MSSQKITILLAEDEPITRRAIQSALIDMGFDVLLACDGDEGCALVDEMKGNCPQLLITDTDMPGCCGEELAQYAREHCPEIKLLITSGAPQPALVKAIAGDANARFLEKPFLPTDLLAVIKSLGVV